MTQITEPIAAALLGRVTVLEDQSASVLNVAIVTLPNTAGSVVFDLPGSNNTLISAWFVKEGGAGGVGDTIAIGGVTDDVSMDGAAAGEILQPATWDQAAATGVGGFTVVKGHGFVGNSAVRAYVTYLAG